MLGVFEGRQFPDDLERTERRRTDDDRDYPVSDIEHDGHGDRNGYRDDLRIRFRDVRRTSSPHRKAYQSVSHPSKPGEHKYATMGSEDAKVTARFYGAWKCPYTRHFVLEFLPTLIEEYVEPGDVAIEFRAVAYEDGEGFHGPDSPRAARAGLVIWNQQPDHFWKYFGTDIQKPEQRAGMGDDGDAPPHGREGRRE